jgi:hypothetical protein
MGADSLAARRAVNGHPARTIRSRLLAATGPTCAIAGTVAALGSFRPWAEATLADRGAHLLIVSRSGWDLSPSGQIVCALGLVVAVVCVLVPRIERKRWPWRLPPVAGAVIVAVTVSRLDAGEPVARKLERLRIGTFQTDAPAAAAGVGFGLWICLAAGILLLLAGTARLAADRASQPPHPSRRRGARFRRGRAGHDGS